MISADQLEVGNKYKFTSARKGFFEIVGYLSADETAFVEIYTTWRRGSLYVTFNDESEIDMMREIISEGEEFSDDSFETELIDYFDECDVQFNLTIDEGSSFQEAALTERLQAAHPEADEVLEEMGFKKIGHTYSLSCPLEIEMS